MRKKIALFLISFFFACNINDNNKVLSIINDVKENYCPDPRVSVFNISPTIKGNRVILKGQVLSAEAKQELLKRLNSYEVIDQIVVLPHPGLKGKTYGIICNSTAQIRRSPEIESEMISQAIMGSEVRVLKYNDINDISWWRYCQFEDNYLGWIMESSIVVGDEEFINNWRKRPKLVVITNYTRVLQQPGINSMPVSDLVRGNKIINLGKKNNWYHVELPDARQGYVKADYVVAEKVLLNKTAPTADDIIKTALSLHGIPYLWGGTSIKGFDCSGFTQSVYKFNGIKLPRDANMQVKQGKNVPLNDSLSYLQPADLLFWGADTNKITHVGLYIGNKRFIHADGRVRINSFNPEHENYSKYHHQTLRKARRILSTP